MQVEKIISFSENTKRKKRKNSLKWLSIDHFSTIQTGTISNFFPWGISALGSIRIFSAQKLNKNIFKIQKYFELYKSLITVFCVKM